jgi:hypothetical protein
MSPDGTIGLIAGNGQFPLLFARAARAQGVRVVAVGMRGETLPQLADEVDSLAWVRVGQLGRTLRLLAAAGVQRAAMAGGLDKRRLFRRARPDWVGLQLLARCALRRDDSMLRAVAAAFEQRGIGIVPSTVFMPDALAPAGVLTQTQPTPRQWQDLAYGLEVGLQIGRLDIGQTVVVREGAVVALEAIEGTDACIARAGVLTDHAGSVVVKVAKPGQDMRFDVPAIGPQTLDALQAAGARVLGIEAGRTLLLEPDKLIERADALNLSIVGLQAPL